VDTLLFQCDAAYAGSIHRIADLKGADAGVAALLELACQKGHLKGALVYVEYTQSQRGAHTMNL
jgi:hypothetical protein